MISQVMPAVVAQVDVHPTGEQEVAESATYFRGD